MFNVALAAEPRALARATVMSLSLATASLACHSPQPAVFIARCYAEHGYATVSGPSVFVSVRLSVKFRCIFFTQVGILYK